METEETTTTTTTTKATKATKPDVSLDVVTLRNVRSLQLCAAGMVTSLSILLPQNQPIVSLIMSTSTPEQVGAFVARTAAAGSLVEFLLNPLMGALGDKYGRKPIFLFAFGANAILRGTAWYHQKSLFIVGANMILSRAFDTIIFTTVRAALSDMLSGEELAFTSPKIATAAGFAVMLGPPISLGITRVTGSHTLPLAIAALLSGFCAYTSWNHLDETLPPSRSTAVTMATASPVAFLAILTHSWTTTKLMTVSLVQTVIDSRNMADTNFAFQKSVLGWSNEDSGKFVVAAGIKILAGGIIGKALIQRIGIRNITSFSNLVNALGSGLLVMAPTWMMYTIYILMFGDRKRDGVESMLTDLATEQGFGRGRVAAALLNWRSLANMGAPLLLSSLLQWGLRKKASTGISYYSSAHHAIGIGICALSEFVYRSIPTEDIDHACGARSRMNLKEIERERVGKEQEIGEKKKEKER